MRPRAFKLREELGRWTSRILTEFIDPITPLDRVCGILFSLETGELVCLMFLLSKSASRVVSMKLTRLAAMVWLSCERRLGLTRAAERGRIEEEMLVLNCLRFRLGLRAVSSFLEDLRSASDESARISGCCFYLEFVFAV